MLLLFLDQLRKWIECLKVELEIEVILVELVHSNVTVFTTASVAFAIGMERQRVDGTEVALDAGEFLLENQMEEASIELANTSRCRCYVHGFLTTSQHNLYQRQKIRSILYDSTDISLHDQEWEK